MSEILEKLQDFDYRIDIPSREREFLIEKRMGIWRYIDPMNNNYPVSITLRQEELKKYIDTGIKDLMIIPVDNDLTLAEKRQYMFALSFMVGVEYLILIDDDVSFYYRDESLSSKYTSKHEEFVKRDCFNKILYECLCLCGEKYPMVGLPLKQGSFGIKYMFPKNIPVIRFMCLHVPTLLKEHIEANGLGVPNMSDRYIQLSLLEKGYRTLSNARYCIGDLGTGYRGGCSTTRTPEVHSLAAEKLMERFPDFVKLKWKEDGHWGVGRKDCVIAWKKFLDPEEKVYLPMEEGLKIIGESNEI